MAQRFRRIAPAADVLSQTVVGESVLLDLRSQKYFGLNEVGTRAWQLLQETDDVAAIHARLLDEYAVAPEQLERDLDELFGRLLAAGLVVERDDGKT
jgi:hypothetical protein